VVISASRAAILTALEVVTTPVIKMATATLAAILAVVATVVAMAVVMVAVEVPLVVIACRTWALA
jgi:hypothetical protein